MNILVLYRQLLKRQENCMCKIGNNFKRLTEEIAFKKERAISMTQSYHYRNPLTSILNHLIVKKNCCNSSLKNYKRRMKLLDNISNVHFNECRFNNLRINCVNYKCIKQILRLNRRNWLIIFWYPMIEHLSILIY